MQRLCGLLIAVMGSQALADEAKKDPFEGSSLSLRHAVNARGLDRSADLTWNPYAGARLRLAPSYALPHGLSLSADWALDLEYTQNDAKPSGFSYGDPSVTVAAPSLYAHKASGLSLDGSATLSGGLSESSRASTRYGSASLGLGLNRSFLNKTLGLRAGLSGTLYGHGATHGTAGQALYADCRGPITLDGVDAACAAELTVGNGSANSQAGLTANLSASYKLPMNMGLLASFGGVWTRSYATPIDDPAISFDGPAGTSMRYALFSDLRVTASLMKRFGVALGAQTAAPQLGADGQYRTPFFNRYSNLYIDLSARY